jgi:hypothetical protein
MELDPRPSNRNPNMCLEEHLRIESHGIYLTSFHSGEICDPKREWTTLLTLISTALVGKIPGSTHPQFLTRLTSSSFCYVSSLLKTLSTKTEETESY